MVFIPIDLTLNDPKTSFYFRLALTTPNHHSKNFKISNKEWQYLGDSNSKFLFSFGYFGVAYKNQAEKKIVISHEGTFFHSLSDIFDIVTNIEYMLGMIPMTQLPMMMCYTQNILVNNPGYEIIHIGVSLGGILAQFELFNDQQVFAIESPGIENIKIANIFSKSLDNICYSLANYHLSWLTPLIPATYLTTTIASFYHYPLLFVPYLSLFHFPKLLSSSKQNDYDQCNLAIAKGKDHIVTAWNKITQYGIKYELEGSEKPVQPIIKLLAYLDPNIDIHDPLVLYKSLIKNYDLTENCVSNSLVEDNCLAGIVKEDL